MKAEDLVSTRECPFCKQMLDVYRVKAGLYVEREQGSDREHACWDMPADADLIVIEASPEGP